MTLMDMAEEICATSGNGGAANSEAMLPEATSGFEWKNSDELWKEWQEEWNPQAQYFRDTMMADCTCWYHWR